MGEKLILKRRTPYQPDVTSEQQIENIDRMMEALDQLTGNVITNCIQAHIAIHGGITPEEVDAMKVAAAAMNAQAMELFRTGFYLSGMSRLQGMIRNPSISPGVTLRALELGFKVNGMIPKAPLIAIQSNTQNTYYEGMLREAKKLKIAGGNGNGTNNSAGS